MYDFTHLFISAAMAQDAAPPMAETGPSAMIQYLPFILIFGVFYMLVIRPQQNKLAEQEKMVKALQRGDRILLNGGIFAKIVKLEGDDQLVVEIADGVQIRVMRSSVQSLEAKTQPVTAASDTAADKK